MANPIKKKDLKSQQSDIKFCDLEIFTLRGLAYFKNRGHTQETSNLQTSSLGEESQLLPLFGYHSVFLGLG